MSGSTGNVNYSDARAVQIAAKYIEGADPNDKTSHSAVHGDFNVLTNSLNEVNAIISAWPEIMQKLAEFAQEILDAIPKPETG